MKYLHRVSRLLAIAGLLVVTSAAAVQAAEDNPEARAEARDLRLVALLPMQEGYGPADHDAYEARIAPIAAEHGMVRSSAYTVLKLIGGAGPENASTLGVWSLASAGSMEAVVSDPRYKSHILDRDRMHDMQHVAMFIAGEEPVSSRAESGHALLVGILAMKPGFGFQDHADYERAIQSITERHGMRLVRSFRVLKSMGGGRGSVVAVNLWDLPKPEALQEIMTDPEYVAHIAYRNLIHDMAATSMYFVAARK